MLCASLVFSAVNGSRLSALSQMAEIRPHRLAAVGQQIAFERANRMRCANHQLAFFIDESDAGEGDMGGLNRMPCHKFEDFVDGRQRIADLKEKIAELRKTKPMCSGTWDKDFELMELEDELAELMAAPEAATD